MSSSRAGTHEKSPAPQQAISALRLGGFAGLGVVVAFAVNGRHFCAHTAQIRGKLAAMMNGMVQAEDRKLNRWPLEHPPKIHDFHQLPAAHFSERFKVLRVKLLVP